MHPCGDCGEGLKEASATSGSAGKAKQSPDAGGDNGRGENTRPPPVPGLPAAPLGGGSTAGALTLERLSLPPGTGVAVLAVSETRPSR